MTDSKTMKMLNVAQREKGGAAGNDAFNTGLPAGSDAGRDVGSGCWDHETDAHLIPRWATEMQKNWQVFSCYLCVMVVMVYAVESECFPHVLFPCTAELLPCWLKAAGGQ